MMLLRCAAGVVAYFILWTSDSVLKYHIVNDNMVFYMFSIAVLA